MAIQELGALLRSGHVSSTAMAETSLAAARENSNGGMVAVTEQFALRTAAAADRELATGVDRGPLHGIPVALKDVIDVAGLPTGLGTAGYGHRVPTEDASVWRALRASGAILIGKTRLPDLALGVITPGVSNPRDPSRISGGSSGGSAAVVAAGVVPVALGTDTGGSIRIPAALTGVAGLRPTHGVLSLKGVSPLSPSQDTIGIIAASGTDCLLTYSAISERGRGRLGHVEPRRGPARIGVPRHLWSGRVSDEVATTFTRACRSLDESGYDVKDCELPLAEAAPAVSYLLLLAEAARMWPIDGDVAGLLSDKVVSELVVGQAVSDLEYRGARQLAAQIRFESMQIFASGIDVIALPTTAGTAIHSAEDLAADELPAWVASAYCRFTSLASVSGLPAISTPLEFDNANLPVGLQFIGPPASEPLLCRLATHAELLSRVSAV